MRKLLFNAHPPEQPDLWCPFYDDGTYEYAGTRCMWEVFDGKLHCTNEFDLVAGIRTKSAPSYATILAPWCQEAYARWIAETIVT